MTNQRIKPLFEDPSASPELRNFVAMARSDGPSEADLDRLAKSLGPVLGVSAGLIAAQASAFGSAPTGLTPGLGSTVGLGQAASAAKTGLLAKLMASTSAKLVAASLSVGAVGVGTWELQHAAPAPRPHAEAAAVQARSASVARTAPARSLTAEQPRDEPGPALEPPAVPARAITATESAPVAASAVRTRVFARSLRMPAVVAPAPELTLAPPAEATPTPALEPVPALAPVVGPPSELSLIRSVQHTLANPDAALALIAQHEQLYPKGALSQEREMLAIEVLLKAGRADAARGRAQRFEASYPGSAHLPRLHALLQRAGAQ